MTGLDRMTAITFLITGGLVTAFGIFSVVGTLSGGVLTLGGALDGNAEVGGVGVVLLLFYGLWMVACLVGGPLQLMAGVRLYKGHPPAALHWLATIAGLVACVTVYCALPGVVSFAFGLASGIAPREE